MQNELIHYTYNSGHKYDFYDNHFERGEIEIVEPIVKSAMMNNAYTCMIPTHNDFTVKISVDVEFGCLLFDVCHKKHIVTTNFIVWTEQGLKFALKSFRRIRQRMMIIPGLCPYPKIKPFKTIPVLATIIYPPVYYKPEDLFWIAAFEKCICKALLNLYFTFDKHNDKVGIAD